MARNNWPQPVSPDATHIGTARINTAPTVSAPRPHPVAQATQKPSKYRNTKVNVDGRKFDSSREHQRWLQLKCDEEAGLIGDLELQVSFVLAQKVVYADGTRKRSLRYVADFTYVRDGRYVIEDVKGFKTEKYEIKKHLMKERLGLDIDEVK